MRLAGALLAIAAIAVATPRAAADPFAGTVNDVDTGAPIAGALIALGDEVVVADARGRFSLPSPSAPMTMIVQAAGYRDASVELARGQRAVRVALVSDAGEVIELVDAAPELAQAETRRIEGEDLRTMPGAMGDALRAVQALPGVARVPFSLGGLALRGQSPRDTDVYLDGIPIPLAFHAGGLTAVVPSATLADIELMSGALDVAYGRVVGGAVLLNTAAPRADRWRARGEGSAVDAQVGLEGPLAGGAIAAGFRRAYLHHTLGPLLPEDTLVPEYMDAQVRWDRPLNGGTLRVFGLGAVDRLTVEGGSATIDSARLAAGWSRTRGPWTLDAVGWLGTEAYAVMIDPPGDDPPANVHREREPYGVRASFTRDAGWGHVAAGLELDGAREHDRDLCRLSQLYCELDESTDVLDVALWTEVRLAVGDRMAVKPGLRVDLPYGGSRYDDPAPRPAELSPRVSVLVRATDALKMRSALAVQRGVHHPSVRAEHPGPIALHAHQGVEAVLPGGVRFATGVFIVHGRRLVENLLDPASGPYAVESTLGAAADELFGEQLEDPMEQRYDGRSRAWGVETALDASIGRWRLLLSYTLSDAQRRGGLGLDDLDDRTGNPTEDWAADLRQQWAPYILDQRHNLSTIAGVALGRWRLGARFRYVSGNPTGPTLNPLVPPRMPAFIQLDLRVDRTWKRRWGSILAFVDVVNATDRDNIEDVRTSDGKPEFTRGLPILPFVGVEYRPPR